MKSRILLTLLAFSLIGCAQTYGRRFDLGAPGKIRMKTTTKKQVMELLGEPFNKSQEADKKEIWQYYHAYEKKSCDSCASDLDAKTLTITFFGDWVVDCTLRLQKTGRLSALLAGEDSTAKCWAR